MSETKFPSVTVQLTGEDGNVFSIIGRVRRAMKDADVPPEAMDAFTHEAITAGTYDEALQVVMRWVDFT